jgi:hypothetical protein
MVHPISFGDLEFRRVAQEFRSSRGVPQTRWLRIGMPYIPQDVINGVFYLYKDRADALAGRSPGGTGFVVCHEGFLKGHAPRWTPDYAVTNWHVACAGGYSTIRLNTKDGGTDIIELGPEDWHFIPGRHDIAAVPLNLDNAIHAVSSISSRMFQAPAEAMRGKVGVGDDVFMIGLFVDHDGVSKNVPSARFGNISMLPNPDAAILQPTGYRGESFVVDMHSRSGFSGSPVYVYRTFGNNLDDHWARHNVEISNMREWGRDRYKADIRIEHSYFRLLGIHWGQFPEKWELRNKSKLSESRRDLITEGGYVEGMSGMTCVIPAWNIIEVLDMPSLKALREASDTSASDKMQPKPEAAIPTEAAPESGNPAHKEDFMSLLGAAATAKKPDA